MAPPLLLPDGWVLISFLALGCTPCRWELSRLLNSIKGRQAAKATGELAETEVVRGAGLKGWLRESICRAAIRTLRATAALAALVWRERRARAAYGSCQGLVSRRACLAAAAARPAGRRVAGLGGGAVPRLPPPEAWTRGARRARQDGLYGVTT